jgi:hypothetical protein
MPTIVSYPISTMCALCVRSRHDSVIHCTHVLMLCSDNLDGARRARSSDDALVLRRTPCVTHIIRSTYTDMYITTLLHDRRKNRHTPIGALKSHNEHL